MNKNSRVQIRESNIEAFGEFGKLLWSTPISSIVLISEYSTDEGPHLDDWFVIFVSIEKKFFYFSTCTAYSEGLEDTLCKLQHVLGPPLALGLQSSTEWASRVIWPESLTGIDYYTFTEVPAVTLFQKLRKKVFGPTYEYRISKAVHEYLLTKL